MAVVAKWKGSLNEDGTPMEFHGGIPARDIEEEEFAVMSDAQKVTLAHSRLYDLRRDAPKAVEQAERRQASEMAQADVTPKAVEAPKAEAKK